ncbi:MAG: hypothetical protein ACSLFM_13745 [Tepidiformaceae bacterium]
MKKTKLPVLLVATLGLLAAFASACGGDDDSDATLTESVDGSGSATDITVNLKNWAVEPSSNTIKAGPVTFRAIHEEGASGAGHGAMGAAGATHQLLVARLKDDADVGDGEFGKPVLNLADIRPGDEKTGEAVLEPGRYELSCLVVERVDGKDVNHYEEGMFALLTVQ